MNRKNHRLLRKDFDEVFNSGKRKHSPFFTIHSISTDDWSRLAFSVVVSKKVVKQAFLRNRTKRRLYSALKEVFSDLKEPIKGIIILKKDVSKTPFKDIVSEIKKTLI